jgi:2-succinyl-6-hydroxy-2,4-cyclohexadiene-1-carboxylate synthase
VSLKQRDITVVLLHGFMGSGEDWSCISNDRQLQYCAELTAPDLPGHGCHPEDVPGQGLQGMAHWLAGYLNQPGILHSDTKQHQKILVGYSLGGRILMTLAAQILAGTSHLDDPQGIAGMIIESAHPGLAEQQKAARWRQDQLWSLRFARQPLKNVLTQWYQQTPFDDLNCDTRADLVDKRSQNNPEHLADIIVACSLARQPDYHSVLLDPPLPIYYWYGRQDKKYLNIARELGEAQSGMEQGPGSGKGRHGHSLVITGFTGAGHNCHLANPAEFSKQLRAVLSELAF